MLPNDQMLFVFESAPPQMVLLDMPSRRLGFVALGRSPVVTWKGQIPDRCGDCLDAPATASEPTAKTASESAAESPTP